MGNFKDGSAAFAYQQGREAVLRANERFATKAKDDIEIEVRRAGSSQFARVLERIKAQESTVPGDRR